MNEDEVLIFGLSCILLMIAAYCLGVSHGIKLSQKINEIFKQKP